MAWQPNTRRPGISRSDGSALTAEDRALELGKGSPLAAYAPQLRVLNCDICDVPIPKNTNFGTKAAWYKFGSWSPENDQEINVSGAHFQLLPCDVDNAGRNGILTDDAASWGDVYGEQACIVIGLNLPGKLFEWTAALAPFSGMGSVGTTPYTPMPGPNYIGRQGFPPGKLSDTIVWKHNIPRAFGVNVARVGLGRSLDVALCVNPNVGGNAFNNADSNLTLCGTAIVAVHCQLVSVGSPFGSNPTK